MRVKKLMPILMFVMAVVTSFAFRAENKVFHDCIWFTFDDDGNVQNTNDPATIDEARTKTQWHRFLGDPDEITTVTCPSANYLCAICVPASEVDDKGTPSPNDDEPKVDDPTTTIYNELPLAKSATSPFFWSDVNHPTITSPRHIQAKSNP